MKQPSTQKVTDIAPQWPDGYNKSEVPKATYGNTLAALRNATVEVRYDTFRNKMMVQGHDLAGEGEVSDHVISILRHLIYEKFRFHPTESNTREAITVIGRQHMFNPVADWLSGLKWDGKPRVDMLFSTYLGAKNTALNRAFARKMLCAMVRRAKEPGHKFDHMVILEGEQDIGKSRFCADLAGDPELFNDTPILNKEAKAQMEAVEGKWVFEIAELQGMKRAEIEKVKAFVSRPRDRERKAYGRFRTEVPRTCIFIGTTNAEFYLKDTTGNRRYWPVMVRRYDQEAFLRDRDQIFAEAVVLEPKEKLWLEDENLREAAVIAQEKRMEPNPYAERLNELHGEEVGEEERIFAKDVWRFLGIETLSGQNQASKIVADAMRHLGWKRRRLRIGKIMGHGYVRKL
jgi:predicted P-loop ATPase